MAADLWKKSFGIPKRELKGYLVQVDGLHNLWRNPEKGVERLSAREIVNSQ